MTDPKLISNYRSIWTNRQGSYKKLRLRPTISQTSSSSSFRRRRTFLELFRKVLDGGIDDIDALVHLAGETVDGHWSSYKKHLIYESRVQSTRFLVEKILSSPSPPKVAVFASAIGFYGQKRADWVTKKVTLAQDS